MLIRPVTTSDLDIAADIDGTIESTRHLWLEQSGEGLSVVWKLEDRALPQKLIRSNVLVDDRLFDLKQIVSGADEGNALLAEHDGQAIGLLAARPEVARRSMEIFDLRVDYDFRRQGIASALLFEIIRLAREAEMQAILATTTTDNAPAGSFLLKCGFEIVGIDRQKNRHQKDLKEVPALLWNLDVGA